MFIRYNSNPAKKSVADCVVRALCVVFDDTWENIYADLTMVGRYVYDMPNSNEVWTYYLMMNGFIYGSLPDKCPACYTIRDFANEHRRGTYVVATGEHVVAVVDGNYFDTADSGSEVPIYYFERKD